MGQILQPQSGSTVTTPFILEWTQNPTESAHTYKLSNTGWISIAQGSDYVCTHTCYMWVDVEPQQDYQITLALTGTGGHLYRQVTISDHDATGGGQEQSPNSSDIGVVTLAEGTTVALDPDASVTLDSGMTVEQMETVGGSVVLALAVAYGFRVVRDQILNRR